METCIYDSECPNVPHSRGLCTKHYGIARRQNTLDTVGTPSKRTVWHRIAEPNAETKTGICSVCGPIDIYLSRKGTRQWWTCQTTIRAASKRALRYYFADGGSVPQEEADAARETFYALQNGTCALCGSADALSLDHCHTTGKLRGLLCGPCNRGLGQFRDNIETLKAAISYLEDSR